jgi:hypothetical protein
MNHQRFISAFAFVLALILVSPVFASQPTSGFAAYEISLTGTKMNHVATVNETLRGSDKPGFSDLILQIIGGEQNFTDSRLVNSSGDYFPYLNRLNSQSVDYANGTDIGYHASISAMGTSSLTFGGSHYILSVYRIEFSGKYGNKSYSANGTLETFPSSLVYSVTLEAGTYTVRAILLGTNLDLQQAAAVTSTAVYVGAGLSLGGLAIVATFIVTRREQKAQPNEDKPLHWVD